MPEKLEPKYNALVRKFPKLIAEYESQYATAKAWDRYMLGRKAAEYRGNLAELDAGRHFIVLTGRQRDVCVCGLEVPKFPFDADFEALVYAPGHLDIRGQLTRVFYYFQYRAPQYYELYVVCQDCGVLEKLSDSTPRKDPEHNCEERNSTIDFQI